MSKVEVSNYEYVAIIEGASNDSFKAIDIWKKLPDGNLTPVAKYTGSGSFMEIKEEVNHTLEVGLTNLLDRCKVLEESIWNKI